MKHILNADQDPAPVMEQMYYDVSRNALSEKIEYWVMDAATLSCLRLFDSKKSPDRGYLECSDFVWTFMEIPIAVVASGGKINQHFVTVVHGYDTLSN